MGFRALLWLGLVMLLGSAAPVDIPYIFDENSHDPGKYDSGQLENISASSPELAGVPPVSSPKNSDILLFPVSKTYKTIGEVKDEFDYRIWQKKGQVYLSQGRYGEALQAFDQSIQLNPRSAESWNYKGIILLLTCKCDEAIRYFDVAIALEPSFATAWRSKAQALYAVDRYDEALLACDKSIQLDPMSAEAWYTKALILKKETDEALSKARELA